MAATPYDSSWTIAEAQNLVRRVWKDLEAVGYHIGLTGSVLTKGKSKKDLDLIIYPRNTATQRRYTHSSCSHLKLLEDVYTVLRKHHLTQWLSREAVQQAWKSRNMGGAIDSKWVEIWLYKGRRVDLMFLD